MTDYLFFLYNLGKVITRVNVYPGVYLERALLQFFSSIYFQYNLS